MKNNWIWQSGVLLLLIAILYGNTIDGDYVFDDFFLIKDNPFIETPQALLSYFTSGTKELAGRPVRLLSFFIDTQIFGKNLIGFHVSNIIYYMAYCLLVFYFLYRLFKDNKLSFIVALIFLSHPLHTEGVAYLSGRKDVLGGIFSVTSLLFFDQFIQDNKKKDGLLTVLFLICAVGTKEIYAIVPLLYLLILDYRDKSIFEYRSFLFLMLFGAALFIGYVLFIRNTAFFDYTKTIPVYGNGQGVNWPTKLKICLIMISLTFFPFKLSADYTYNAIKRIDYSEPVLYLSIAFFFLCLTGVACYRKKNKQVAFALSWIVICLLPVCQIIPYPEIISERSLIFLSLGSSILIAVLIMQVSKKYIFLVTGVIVIVFSLKTIDQNRVWTNEYTLWKSASETYPDCARARYNLGLEYAYKKDYQSAKREFAASLEINPVDITTVPDYSINALLNLGNIYLLQKNIPDAEQCYKRIIAVDKNHIGATKNLEILEKIKKRQSGNQSSKHHR